MNRLLYIVICAVLFCSCATKTKIEYRDRVVDHYITNTVHDTLVDKTTDSVYVNIYTKGDTVFKERYKEKIRWRDKIVVKHDTCRVDSIVTVRKEITVEKTKIPKLCYLSLAFCGLFIIFAIIKLTRFIQWH